MINLRTIESCLREGETHRNVEYGMVTLKCDVVFHIESRLVALVNAGKNVDAGTFMVSVKSWVGSRPWDSSSVSLTSTPLLPQINYRRQTGRGEG